VHETERHVTFSDTGNYTPVTETHSRNKITMKWKGRLEQRREKGSLANTVEDTLPQGKRQYIIGVDNEELRRGIMGGTIPSTIADSGATSGVGTKDDPSHRTGKPSDKRFILPSREVIQATEKAEYPFNIRAPANELHITPGVSQHSLLSMGKYADANYITVFDKDTVNVYDANDTIITVTRDAILRGWRDTNNKLWRIPLVDMVQNLITDSIIVNQPPTEFLPNPLPTKEAIYNVYKLKTRTRQIPSCGSWIPHKTTMDRGHQKQTICIVAGTLCGSSTSTFPRGRQNPQWPWQENPKRIKINEAQGTTRDSRQ